MKDTLESFCKNNLSHTEEITLSIICGKWKFRILYRLIDGPKRFNELKKSLNSISARTLTTQLKELETHQVIDRIVATSKPLKVEYSFSKRGETLIPVLNQLAEWGMNHCAETQKKSK